MKKYIAIIALLCVGISVFASGFDEAKRDSILRHISGAKIPTRTVNILKFGAKGDGKKDCLPAFRKALKQSAQRGGAAYHCAGWNILYKRSDTSCQQHLY